MRKYLYRHPLWLNHSKSLDITIWLNSQVLNLQFKHTFVVRADERSTNSLPKLREEKTRRVHKHNKYYGGDHWRSCSCGGSEGLKVNWDVSAFFVLRKPFVINSANVKNATSPSVRKLFSEYSIIAHLDENCSIVLLNPNLDLMLRERLTHLTMLCPLTEAYLNFVSTNLVI